MRAALQSDLEVLRDLGAAESDSPSVAEGVPPQEESKDITRSEFRNLDQIEDAISHLITGDLNSCANCSDDLPLDQLHALPYANLCVVCQLRLERSGCADWSKRSDKA